MVRIKHVSVIWTLFQSKSTLIVDTQWDNTDTIASPLGRLSIHLKIPEISVTNQMEQTILVRSYRNIWGYLWRWSTLTSPIISISRTEMCLFISALFVSCLQMTKRAVAWVGSVQPECTVRLGTWNFRILKSKFLSNESGLGTGIINRVTVLPPICNKPVYVEPSIRRKAFRTCLVPWRLYVDRSRRMKRDKRNWREHDGSEGPWEWGKEKRHPITPRALKAGALWLRDETGFRANNPDREAFPPFSQSRIINTLFESKLTLKLINFKNCETVLNIS